MRVVLTVETGAMVGRRVWLQAGGDITVGRTVKADFVVPDDPLMSSVHFALRCDQQGCRLLDLESRNGTFLNRRRVSEVEIQDGDRIVAGRTGFCVEFEPLPAAATSVPVSTSAPRHEDNSHHAELSDAGGPSASGQHPATVSFGYRVSPGATDDLGGDVVQAVLSYSTWQGERRTWLRPGQSVSVGRTQRADFVVDDESLDELHFALDCEQLLCRVRDFRGGNGVQVNGMLVSEALVFDGDVIQAGTTRFSLRVEGGPEAPNVNERPGVLDTSSRSVRLVRRPANCRRELCRVERVWRLRGSSQGEASIELARQLSEIASAYLVVDVMRVPELTMNVGVPGELLLDWLPEPSARICSPRIWQGLRDVERWLPQLWQNEALICFFSLRDAAECIGHLRHMSRLQPFQTQSRMPRRTSVFAFYRPPIMSALLAAADQALVAELLTGWDAVFMSGESGQGWELFADATLCALLQQEGAIQLAP